MTNLKEYVRESARVAETECQNDDFNAMTWLDVTLEDNPEFFDSCFDTPWHQLLEDERVDRTNEIRRVL
ncbi:MAG: hypothetical protein ACN4GW_06205 [Desulforhopalus sp.]